MEASSQKIRPHPEDDLTNRSPVLRLLLVTDKGMVFESRTSFSVGSSIELAVHVPPQGTSKGPATRTAHSKSEFITSEGLVVSCARHSVAAGAAPVYEVTLLFASLRSRDRRKLRHLASKCRQPMEIEPEAKAPESLCDFMGLN